MTSRYRSCVIVLYRIGPVSLSSCLETVVSHVIGCEPSDIFVMCPSSHLPVLKLYRKLKKKYNQCVFIGDDNFRLNIISIVSNPYYSHILFVTDDCLFVRTVNISNIVADLDSSPMTLAISLTVCLDKVETFKTGSDLLIWNRKQKNIWPATLSGCVYRSSLLKHVISMLPYCNQDMFIDDFVRYIDKLENPWIAGYLIPVVVTTNMRQNQK